MPDSIYLYQSVSLSPSVLLTFTPNIPILFAVIPQHIIFGPIHCIDYIPLLKTLQSLLVRCAATLL